MPNSIINTSNEHNEFHLKTFSPKKSISKALKSERSFGNEQTEINFTASAAV